MIELHEILSGIFHKDPRAIGRAISIIEENDQRADEILRHIESKEMHESTILGITGPIGVGKSTIINQLITSYRKQGRRVGVVAIDPSSPLSSGALLGDRIRMMRHAIDHDVVVRSMATRGKQGGLCAAAGAAARIMICSGCNPVIIETVGVGQAEIDVVNLADITVLVLAPGLGDEIQAMKAGFTEIADILVVNKADMTGAAELILELESVTRGRNCTVCSIVASDRNSVDKLATTLLALEHERRSSGHFIKKRQKAREAEVMDWAMEMLRLKLKKQLREYSDNLSGDPRILARKLIEEICIAEAEHCKSKQHTGVFT